MSSVWLRAYEMSLLFMTRLSRRGLLPEQLPGQTYTRPSSSLPHRPAVGVQSPLRLVPNPVRCQPRHLTVKGDRALDKAKNAVQDAGGKAKEAVGKTTADHSTEAPIWSASPPPAEPTTETPQKAPAAGTIHDEVDQRPAGLVS
jgi:hypothetical protein